ncbi:hypothetical protein POTOM_017222 [Populus tomentosa]|uniref:EF-hand domain-containing protein n=1 Tax=Populus tomentosa TaxID=118781 RepID=A0A8X7ZYI4_POPTO|nr:hypothetical protein POTOM_017222 [Populus tomentosa]
MAKSRNPTAFGSMDDIRKVFNKFDKNGDGKISCSEVVDNLSELGTKISPAEVELIMQEFDKDGDGYIDLDEFVDFIQNGGLGDSGGNDSKELRDAFDLYDKNKNGLISVDELHSIRTLTSPARNLLSLVGCEAFARISRIGINAILRSLWMERCKNAQEPPLFEAVFLLL